MNLLLPSIRSLSFLLFLPLLCYAQSSPTQPPSYEETSPIRIAFIFAGSPRSFIFPSVHESIRTNLITAFCPPSSCIADVFVRISRSDNAHQKASGAGLKDSRGIPIPPNEQELPLIKHAISRLNPLSLSPSSSLSSILSTGVVDVVWTNVGSTNEYEEMAVRLPSPRHRIFRDLDPRRYSMHFNRWSAFQQAKDFERRHNISYSWFVHSRLDMAVGQPLPSYSSYSPFQVFVPDLWFSDVPDTFALIPATYSDAYFSMDVMVEKGNMCLGGPNFDLSSATPSSLKTRFNYSVAMINEVQLCLCRTTQEGFSEQILRRKLASKGISLWAKTLVFTSFFLVVVRKDWRNYCEFLRPDFFIGWLLKSQAANTALYPACLLMIKDLQREEAAPSCTPLSIAPIALSTNNSNTSPQKSAIYNSNCLLNKAKSDWNFMPLRIQRPRASGGGCLTLSPSSPSSKDADKTKDGLRMKPCIAHEIVSFDTRVNGSYSISQLFFFHPLDANAQTVRHLKYSNTRNEHLCLTISGDESGKALSSQLKGRMESCRTVHNDDQLIQVMLYGRRKKVKKFSAAVSTQGGSMVAEAQPILRVKEYVSFIKRGKCLLHSKTSEEVVWGECPTKKKFSSRGGKKRRERAIGREQRRLSEEGLGGGGDNSMIGGSNSAGAVPTDHVFIIERTST